MEKIRGFEIAKGFENAGINLPVRKTKYSAGYDIEAAEDTVVPSFKKGMNPTLIKTGLKAYMQADEYLKLCNRSSNPKKKGLILSNSIGVVDADYYENPDNDGHIMFAFYNIKEEDIIIKKGEAIGQAIFEKYLVADGDQAEGERIRRLRLNKSKIERKIHMTAIEIRNKFLNYFKNHGHSIIPSAPLIPENDPSVLFTTAGMHPLVPYLLGEEHPQGKRLADYQKCLRTVDIDEVGDNRHLTYFEMLGNWSLGDYFKEDSIKYSMEFLTKELGIPLEKLSVTCFKGDEDAPRDEETAKLWDQNGMPKEKIYYFGKDDNWWIAGETGPCGPDTEIFYDTGKKPCSADCNPSCGCGKYVEIWNNVFMEYYKDEKGNYTKLKQKNVDTGLGLERINMLLQGKETPFDTEIFAPMMEKLQALAKNDSIESRRIIAEHLRSSMMIIADGGKPSNIDRGYILRRLIRRMIRHLNKLEIDLGSLTDLINLNIEILGEMYPELVQNKELIIKTILEEKDKFMKTLENGEKELLKELNKLKEKGETLLSGEEVFRLYETYGFPQEVTKEISEENGFKIDLSNFDKLFKEHQEKSRQGSEQKFKRWTSRTKRTNNSIPYSNTLTP